VAGEIKSLIRNRNFLLLWCAYGISAMGDHLSEMAVLATQNALDKNIDITPIHARMTFVFMVPFFLFGTLTGALADRLPRRAMMIVADVSRVVVMFFFVHLIRGGTEVFGDVWGPFLPLGMVGLFAATFAPARQAMVPTLVRSEELVSANAIIGGLGLIGTLVAMKVGGVMADRGMIEEAFHLDAATFAASAVCICLISAKRGKIAGRERQTREPIFRSVAAGLRYIAGHRRVAQLIGIAVVYWFAGATVKSLLPAIVKDVFHGSFSDIGSYMACLGGGLAFGAVTLFVFGNALRSDVAITYALFGTAFGVACLACTVFFGFEVSTARVIGAISVFISGWFALGILVSYNTMLQRFVPNQYRGRVFGIVNLTTIGGLLVATGVLAIPTWEHLDQWAGFILAGLSVLLCVVGAGTLVSRMRKPDLPFVYNYFCGMSEFWTKFWYRLTATNRCTIPRTGPVIVTANHESPLDPFFIYAFCRYRHIAFMIAKEYTNMPLAKYLFQAARCIPVRRGANDIGSTKEALRRLRNGDVIGIFIQGGIRGRDDKSDLKNGLALLALKTGATVIPAHISGVTYGKSMLGCVLRRHHARVAFGKPVDLSEFGSRARGESLDAASRKVYDAINALAPDKQG
jgi:1-acyl-sn-glycerol-3-phosphate acyltransferase